ncbi:MAG: MFS transporter [Candidatus Binatia bacterium]
MTVHRDPARIRRAYYVYQATANAVFFQAVFFVYYGQRVGLAVPAILWLQSYFTALRALLDLPLGAVADRWSRRGCLVASNAALALGAIGLVLWPTGAMAVAAETAFALASALRSGADSAFLFDALAAAGATGAYARAESRGQAVSAAASGLTAVAGSLLAAVDLRLPYVAAAAAAAVGATVALRLGAELEPRRRADGTRTLVRDAAGYALRTPAVRWTIALATFAVVVSHVYFFLQQPWMESLGVPVAAFGLVFAATKVVTALVANAAHRVDARVGRRGVGAAMTIVPALGLGAMALAHGPFAAVLLLSRGVLDGLWQPLANVYLNRLVESRLRATLLSLQSLVARLALAGALAVLGAGAARLGLATTLAMGAVGAAVLGVVLLARAPHGLPGRARVMAEGE